MDEYVALLEEVAEAAKEMLSLAPGTAKHYNAVQRLKAALDKLDDYWSAPHHRTTVKGNSSIG